MYSPRSPFGRSRRKSATTVLLTGLFVIACGGETGAVGAESTDHAGSALGSTDDVEWIQNGLQLRQMRLTGNYALANDIYLTNYGWNPIGTPGNPFRGTFDGMGHVINNLNINKAGASSAGMFGAAKEAIIRNVGLTNVKVTGGNTTGALVGVVFDSEITSIYVTGRVTASSNTESASAGMAVGSMYGKSLLCTPWAPRSGETTPAASSVGS